MRPDRLNPLCADVASLPGVGPAAHRALERLGITRERIPYYVFRNKTWM